MISSIQSIVATQRASAALLACTLGVLCVPAIAGGAIGHEAPSFEALSGKGAGVLAGTTEDSPWVFPAEQVFAADLAQGLAEFPESRGDVHPNEGTPDLSFSQVSEDHRRHDGGDWLDHGGLQGSHWDDGNFDDRHFCDDRCVTPTGAVPEPGTIALMVAGLAAVVFRVKRGRAARSAADATA